MHRTPHILNAASNLLGISFVIIGGLKFGNLNPHSFSDEIAWFSAFTLLTAIMASYAAIRNNYAVTWQIVLADVAFLTGVVSLMISVLLAAITL